MTDWVDRVKEKLAVLWAAPPDSLMEFLFDENGRVDYWLRPPLDESEIAAFERKFGVRLPEHYRRFLHDVGDGGVGPGLYGLPSLREPVRADYSRLSRPFPLTRTVTLERFQAQLADSAVMAFIRKCS